MIKAVFLDVNGVLIGNAPGITYPDPHDQVLARLISIKHRGIVVVLCTSDPFFIVKQIVASAELENFHIVNSGREVVDAVSETVFEMQPGSMKGDAVQFVLKQYNIIPDDALGIGDSVSDWDFLKLCGCAGAMGNAGDELKQLVMSKGPGRGCVGRPVNENGVLDIFDFYNL